ncbi:NAD(P)/FAD-dependent oxidoreductase [Azorhizophilus paspali]
MYAAKIPFESDVVIVGGGISGLSAALQALDAGCSVTVLEALRVGAGATGRNSGFVVPVPSRHTPESLRHLLGDAAQRFVHALQQTACDILTTSSAASAARGWIQPWASHPLPDLIALARGWRALGIDVEVVEREQMKAALETEHYAAGLCYSAGGSVDPYALAQEMASAVTQRGGVILEDCPVLKIKSYATYVGVITPRGEVKAGRIFVAGNVYGIEASRITRQAVSPIALVLATFAMPHAETEPLTGQMPFSDSRKDMWFFRRLERGRVLTGCFALPLVQSVNACCDLLRERVCKVYQRVPVAIEHQWAGWVGLTHDGMPLVRQADERIVSWSGCNGRGIALSILMGRTLMDCLLGRDGIRLPFKSPNYLYRGGLFGWLAQTLIAIDRYKQRRTMLSPSPLPKSSEKS